MIPPCRRSAGARFRAIGCNGLFGHVTVGRIDVKPNFDPTLCELPHCFRAESYASVRSLHKQTAEHVYFVLRRKLPPKGKVGSKARKYPTHLPIKIGAYRIGC